MGGGRGDDIWLLTVWVRHLLIPPSSLAAVPSLQCSHLTQPCEFGSLVETWMIQGKVSTERSSTSELLKTHYAREVVIFTLSKRTKRQMKGAGHVGSGFRSPGPPADGDLRSQFTEKLHVSGPDPLPSPHQIQGFLHVLLPPPPPAGLPPFPRVAFQRPWLPPGARSPPLSRMLILPLPTSSPAPSTFLSLSCFPHSWHLNTTWPSLRLAPARGLLRFSVPLCSRASLPPMSHLPFHFPPVRVDFYLCSRSEQFIFKVTTQTHIAKSNTLFHWLRLTS